MVVESLKSEVMNFRHLLGCDTIAGMSMQKNVKSEALMYRENHRSKTGFHPGGHPPHAVCPPFKDFCPLPPPAKFRLRIIGKSKQ